jgi:hypothetical protein
MKVKSVFKSFIIVFTFLCLSPVFKAQATPSGPGPDPDPTPNGVPLDGGLTMLVAAGIGYAAKRRYDKRSKENGSENILK